MYLEAVKSDSAGGLCVSSHQRVENEAMYQKNSEAVMTEDQCIKVIIYRNEGKITFELLASMNDDDEEESANEGDEESNSTQSSRTLRSSAKTSGDNEELNEKLNLRIKNNPLFLKSFIRKYKAKSTEEADQKDNANSNDEKLSDSKIGTIESGKNDIHPECNFSFKNFKSVLFIQNDSVLYRRKALSNARKVSLENI